MARTEAVFLALIASLVAGAAAADVLVFSDSMLPLGPAKSVGEATVPRFRP